MVEINNLTSIPLNKKLLEKVARRILKGEKKERTYQSLSIAFVEPKRIKEINKKYRRRNKVTDVLSFAESNISGIKSRASSPKKPASLGEIIICPQEVKKNAKEYGLIFRNELILILIHGILHLLGYNHEKPSTRAKLGAGLVPHRNKVSGAGSEAEEKKMEKKEEFYLSQISTKFLKNKTYG
jgi:probable rRNA maturation factor